MFTRKLMTFAGLAFAVAALTPASALAKAGGTDRPYLAFGSGISVSTAVGPLSFVGYAEGSEIKSHLGTITYRSDPQYTTITGFTPDFSFLMASVSVPRTVITAANGDELYSSQTGTGTATLECIGAGDGCVVTFHQHSTIDGGTGRFKDASGTAEITMRAVRTSTSGGTSTFTTEQRAEGTISY